EWMYDLGWVEFKQGQYDEAAETLAAALALRPDDFLSGLPSGQRLAARLKLADTWLAAGQFEAAEKLYTAIIHEDPNRPEGHYGLGRVEAAQHDTKDAGVTLDTSRRL